VTVRKLKEILEGYSDSACIHIDDGSGHSGRSTEVIHIKGDPDNGSAIILQTRETTNITDALAEIVLTSMQHAWSDADFYHEVMENGLDADDFQEPEHARMQMQENGLI